LRKEICLRTRWAGCGSSNCQSQMSGFAPAAQLTIKQRMPTKTVLLCSEFDMIIVAHYRAKGNEEIWTIRCIIK
jgi:hypothetical protein